MTDLLAGLETRLDEQIRELQPFDACVWLGTPDSGDKAYANPIALRSALEAQGIRRALVSHTMTQLLDPIAGNQALANALAEVPGWFGVMALLPPGTGEYDDVGAYIDRQVEQNLRAARLCPKAHRYSLRLPTIPSLLSALESRGIALLIPVGQTAWDEIGPIALEYRRLAILVEGTGHHEYLNIRTCLAWLEAAPNLLVSTHRQFLCGGLELMVERLGVHRVFFATNQPIDDPAAGLSHLALSRLPMNVRKQIAHGNLERLLAAVGRGGYFG